MAVACFTTGSRPVRPHTHRPFRAPCLLLTFSRVPPKTAAPQANIQRRFAALEWSQVATGAALTPTRPIGTVGHGQGEVPGVALLSGILRGNRAVEVNIGIIRALVRLGEILAGNKQLARKVSQHDGQIGVLFEHVQKLLEQPEPKKKRPIGFIRPKDD